MDAVRQKNVEYNLREPVFRVGVGPRERDGQDSKHYITAAANEIK